MVACCCCLPSLFSPSDLCSFVAFVLLYIVVLFLQRNTQDAFGVETSILDSVFDMVSCVALAWLRLAFGFVVAPPSLTNAFLPCVLTLSFATSQAALWTKQRAGLCARWRA